MLFFGNNVEAIKEARTEVSSKFDMKDLNATNLVLGI